MIKIIISSNYSLIREGLKSVLDPQTIKITGEVEDLEQTILLVKEKHPDLLLFDLNLLGQELHPALNLLSEVSLSTKILVMLDPDKIEFIEELIKCGVSGFITHADSLDTFLRAIQAVGLGDIWISSMIANSPKLEQISLNPDLCKEELFSDREMEVLHNLSQGLSNKEISESLNISEGTVKNHLINIYQKLNIHSRSEAIIWYWKKKQSA